MIPKTIHYVWVGGNSLTPLADKCMESWKKYCPDYEFKKWDESNFDITINQYCKEAYNAGKYAFVSDYIRLFVLVNFGGVYMDTDVELIKQIDNFLVHQAFSGFESENAVPTGIMACEKGFTLFNEMLAEYNDRKYIMANGEQNVTSNVVYITKLLIEKGLQLNNCFQIIDGFALYPNDVFCPKDFSTHLIRITENSHSIHHFAGSWLPEEEYHYVSLTRRIYNFYGENIFSKTLVRLLFIMKIIKKQGFMEAVKFCQSKTKKKKIKKYARNFSYYTSL